MPIIIHLVSETRLSRSHIVDHFHCRVDWSLKAKLPPQKRKAGSLLRTSKKKGPRAGAQALGSDTPQHQGSADDTHTRTATTDAEVRAATLRDPLLKPAIPSSPKQHIRAVWGSDRR